MKPTPFLFLLALPALALQAAPPSIAVFSETDTLKKLVTESGATLAKPETADVLLVGTSKVDQGVLEAAAKRGAGILLIGSALEAGSWLKPLVGGAWTGQSRSFASQMMLYR